MAIGSWRPHGNGRDAGLASSSPRPCGGVAGENTTFWTGPVASEHDPDAHLVPPKECPGYAHVRAGRTVLLSAASQPASEPVVIRAATNEGGMVPEVLQALETTSGALIAIDSLDAGLCSQAKARLIAAGHKGDIVEQLVSQLLAAADISALKKALQEARLADMLVNELFFLGQIPRVHLPQIREYLIEQDRR